MIAQIKKKLLLAAAFAGINLCAFAQQEARAELIAMNKLYTGAQAFSMKVNVSVYKTNGSTHPSAVYSGEVKKKGTNYYSQMMSQKTIANENCMLVVDEERKSIAYSKPYKAGEPMDEAQLGIMFDSLLFSKGTVRLLAESAKRKQIEIMPGNDLKYERILISINPVTRALEEVTYFYKTGSEGFFGRVTIKYTDVNLNSCGVDNAFFSEKNYISKVKGKVKGTGKYATYEINDHSNFNYKDYE